MIGVMKPPMSMLRVLFFFAFTYCVAAADPDLRIHWQLDESSGSSASDASGNGHAAEYERGDSSTPTPSWDPAGGIIAGTVCFSDTDDETLRGSEAVSGTGLPYSVSLWVKTTSGGNDTVAVLSDGSGGSYYSLQVVSGEARLTARNTSADQLRSGETVANGDWHHIVAVFESDNRREIYVDGESAGTDTSSVPEFDPTKFSIGALDRNSISDEFDGCIDDVALWTRVLTENEILLTYELGSEFELDASEVRELQEAFDIQGSVAIGASQWIYVSSLAGSLGTTSGTLADQTASIVMDDSGNGMRIESDDPPSIIAFVSDRPATVAGNPVSLSWSIANAATASIQPGDLIVNATSGNVSVSPSTTTTYTITASNGNGTDSTSVTVNVTNSTLLVTEFVALNESGLSDERGNFSDWIEIWNPTSTPTTLDGFYLTDDPTNLTAWAFPVGTTLGADTRLILFASGEDRRDPASFLHTNFSLDADGDYLALVAPDGTTIIQEFAPTFPPQSEDIAFGLTPEGEQRYLSPPSPGLPNPASDATAVLKRKPDISPPGGIFSDASISVALSHVDPLATIRYTTDGSVPDSSSPAYSEPLEIDETTLLISRAFKDGHIPGPLEQESYIFVAESVRDFDSNIPVLVIDTFDTDLPREDREFRQSIFAGFSPDESSGRTLLSTLPSITGHSGIHVRGESSSAGGFNKLNFSFETRDPTAEDESTPLFDLPSESDWALHASEIDRTFARDRLPHMLFREIGRYSPRVQPVEVYLNTGRGRVSRSDFRGLYNLTERIKRDGDRVDIDTLRENENEEPYVTGGMIFKRDKSDPDDVTVDSRNFRFAFVYPSPENVTDAQEDWLDDTITELDSDLDSGDFSLLDLPSFVDFYVIQELTKEVDSYVFSTYFNIDRGGLINAGPLWDFDRSFGNTNAADEASPTGWRRGELGEDRGWFDRLFDDVDFEQLFTDRFQELVAEDILTSSHIGSMIDGIAAEVSEAQVRNFEPRGPWPLAVVTRSHLTFRTYEEHVDYMKTWVEDRLEWMASQFVPPPGVTSSQDAISISSEEGQIYFTIDGTDPRASGGSISGTAYTGPISISQTTTVTARVLSSGEWSGPVSRIAVVGTPASAENLVVSKIMYHPSDFMDPFEDDDFEYLELMNISDSTIQIDGVTISGGIDFNLEGEMAPGERVVIARDETALGLRYGSSFRVIGSWGSKKLDNRTEEIILTAADSSIIRSFSYEDRLPWPTAPDGNGPALVLFAPATNPDHGDAFNWRPGAGDIPGASDTIPFSGSSESDLLDYALTGTRPRIASFPSLTVTRSTTSDAAVVIEQSPDLLSWSPTSKLALSSRTGESDLETLVFDLPSTPMFYRVKAILP